MEIYPESLGRLVRDDLLQSQSFFEPGQFAYILEISVKHYLRHHPVELLEVTLDPSFLAELRTAGVEVERVCGMVASRLLGSGGGRVRIHVVGRAGMGLGSRELGLGPGDYRFVEGGSAAGDLVAHFLDGDTEVYSQLFEGELHLAPGKVTRSWVLKRIIEQKYGEIRNIYEGRLPPSQLEALDVLEVRVELHGSGGLEVEIEPVGRRQRVRLGERVEICEVEANRKLSFIVLPRGQELSPPEVKNCWVAVASHGRLEVAACIRDPFELQDSKVLAFVNPRHGPAAEACVELCLVDRKGSLQIFRGGVDGLTPALAPGVVVDLRLSGRSRTGFSLESTGRGIVETEVLSLERPEPVAAPGFLTPELLARGFDLEFLLRGSQFQGGEVKLICRQDNEILEVGSGRVRQGQVRFSVSPLESGLDEPLSFWVASRLHELPLTLEGNGRDSPLLSLPIYPIPPGARPLFGRDNFLFSGEELLFGDERLRLVRWSPTWKVVFPDPEAYPYFLWRSSPRLPRRFEVLRESFAVEGDQTIQRVVIGADWKGRVPMEGEKLVSIAALGRDSYMFIESDGVGGVRILKAAGRVHNVSLNFQPLESVTSLPSGRSLLVAGNALFGVEFGEGSLELALLGHYLSSDALSVGIRLTSGDVADGDLSSITIAAHDVRSLVLTKE